MDSSLVENVADVNATSSTAAPQSSSLPPAHNHDEQLVHTLKQLSIDTKTTASMSVEQPSTATPQRITSLSANVPSSPGANGGRPPGSPSRHIGSPSSINGTVTPTLRKKSSMSSVQNVGGVTPPRQPASRRSSTQLQNGLGGLVKSPLAGLEEQTPIYAPVTAASVARTHFGAELAAFHGMLTKLCLSRSICCHRRKAHCQ